MQAYTITSGEGVESLRRQDLDLAPLGVDEVRIRVRAASLNARDTAIAEGRYKPSTRSSFVPLSDGAGEVVEVGAAVDGFAVGARVIANFWPFWADGPMTVAKTAKSVGFELDGMLAETFTAPATAFAAAPKSLSFEEAATLPCAGLTAWNALFVEGRVRPGATVLILGTGGVAVWALQLAAAAGCRPIVLSSDDGKLERASLLGAAGGINYRSTPDWPREVLKVTEGRGADLVIEVGGEGTLVKSVEAATFGGTVITVGGLSGFGSAGVGSGMLIGGGKRLCGIMVGSRVMLEDLVRFVDVVSLKPVIDRSFAFEEAAQAFAHIKAARQFGKVVVRTAV